MRYITLAFGAAATFALAGAQPALAASPYAQPDDSWISLSGTVVNPTSNSFRLDYGDGLIMVEMDDWDSYGDAYGLMDGDRVTVYGTIDADLFEKRTIEAGSVYVEGLNTFFYASAADEEGAGSVVWPQETVAVLVSQTNIRGTVSSVNEPEGEFTVDTGAQEMKVEIERMAYNPLDEYGYQKISKGDVVSVTGQIDRDFFEGRVLDATSVVTLFDNANRPTKK